MYVCIHKSLSDTHNLPLTLFVSQSFVCPNMNQIMTFWSTTDCIYDGSYISH